MWTSSRTPCVPPAGGYSGRRSRFSAPGPAFHNLAFSGLGGCWWRRTACFNFLSWILQILCGVPLRGNVCCGFSKRAGVEVGSSTALHEHAPTCFLYFPAEGISQGKGFLWRPRGARRSGDSKSKFWRLLTADSLLVHCLSLFPPLL